MKTDYTNLSFTQLVDKIETNRFFDLPRMVREAFRRLTPQEPKYKVYTALLTQTGTAAPAATVLENTIGDVVFEREDVGQYKAILEGAFTEGKTSATLQSTSVRGGIYAVEQIEINYISIVTVDAANDDSDELLSNSLFEIRVYN